MLNAIRICSLSLIFPVILWGLVAFYSQNPLIHCGGIALGGLFAVFLCFFSDQIILKLHEAKPLEVSQKSYIHQIVVQFSKKYQLPVPKIYTSELLVPFSFSVGRNRFDAKICFSEGLLMGLDRRQLESIIQVELDKIKQGKTLLNGVCGALIWILKVPRNCFKESVTILVAALPMSLIFLIKKLFLPKNNCALLIWGPDSEQQRILENKIKTLARSVPSDINSYYFGYLYTINPYRLVNDWRV